MSSCRDNAAAQKAIETFFIFVLQIVSFALFGISSLILSVVGSTAKTSTPKIIGGILLGIFIIITVSCFNEIQRINPKRDYIYIAFVVDALIIGLSIFYLTKSKKEVEMNDIKSTEELDKIIEAEEITIPEEKDDDSMEII